jgi:hypothetical protein
MKDVLGDLYNHGRGIPGESKDLLLVYNIMHCMYRAVLNPKVGNVNEIHAFLIDLLYITHQNRGSGVQLDVMDYLWNEIQLAIYYRKRPPFAPHVMKFLCQKWPDKDLGDLLESDVDLMAIP